MKMVRVTEITESREFREIVLNIQNIESITDEVITRVITVSGQDRGLKDLRSVQCTMTSGKKVCLRFDGTASELAVMINNHKHNAFDGITRYLPNWTWEDPEDDNTESFPRVLDVDEEEAPFDPSGKAFHPIGWRT